MQMVFLSTPSGWRATGATCAPRPCSADFYPRPPGGGRPPRRMLIPLTTDFYPRPPGGGRRLLPVARENAFDISIHALRVEGDTTPCHACFQLPVFLSTPSGWRATVTDPGNRLRPCRISIHALRVEGDFDLR